MSRYVLYTVQEFEKKLAAGAYKNPTGANRAIGKAQKLTKSQRTYLKRKVNIHFETKSKAGPKRKSAAATRASARTVKFEKKAGAPVVRTVDERASARPPFTVTFTKMAMNRKKAKGVLDFIQEAMDAEYTLPDLVHALELVL